MSHSPTNSHAPLHRPSSFCAQVDAEGRIVASSGQTSVAQLARQVLDSLPQTIFETDRQGQLIFANRHGLSQWHYTAEEIATGLPLQQLFAPNDRERLQQLLNRALHGDQNLAAEFTVVTKQGGRIPALLQLSPRDDNGQVIGARGLLQDLSRQKQAELALSESEQRCQHLAQHDPLTDLPNRSLFMERLDQALNRAGQRGKSLAVVILDLDRFKQVADSLGNHGGDLVLREITRRLRSQLRQSDLLARLNGDEFALIYSTMPRPDQLALLAQRLLDVLQAPIEIADHAAYLTASIGIAASRNGTESAATLLRQATIAMDEAKQQGGNHYAHFDQAMQTRRDETFLFEKHMREALRQQEFYLHYQPQIDLANGRITGVEALVRWAGPKGDNPSPELFIKVAEDSGLIHPLGDFILHEACRQNLRWQQSGLAPIQVTVNISAKQFGQPDFVDKVLQTLVSTGLAPQWLELEITESAIMANIKEAIGIMHRLQQAGVRFAIDDFGTGHSSLNYLRQLPLSKLKIDRSFLLEVPGNRDNEKLIFSILALARSFDLQTVAEGIETQDQLTYLQQLDCDLGQGYLFSRPVAPEAIPALLAAASA